MGNGGYVDRRLLLSAPYLIWLFALVLAPFSLILATSVSLRDAHTIVQPGFTTDAYLSLFDPLYLQVLGRTLLFAGTHTLITITAAYPVAFFLSRLERTEAGVYITLLLVPFWTNFLIRLLAFMDVLRLEPSASSGPSPSTAWWRRWFFNTLPSRSSALRRARKGAPLTALEAAQDLGRAKRQVFLEVVWPLTKSAVFATSLLVFIPAIGEYLTPELVGGGQSFYLGTSCSAAIFLSRATGP